MFLVGGGYQGLPLIIWCNTEAFDLYTGHAPCFRNPLPSPGSAVPRPRFWHRCPYRLPSPSEDMPAGALLARPTLTTVASSRPSGCSRARVWLSRHGVVCRGIPADGDACSHVLYAPVQRRRGQGLMPCRRTTVLAAPRRVFAVDEAVCSPGRFRWRRCVFVEIGAPAPLQALAWEDRVP